MIYNLRIFHFLKKKWVSHEWETQGFFQSNSEKSIKKQKQKLYADKSKNCTWRKKQTRYRANMTSK